LMRSLLVNNYYYIYKIVIDKWIAILNHSLIVCSTRKHAYQIF
jgi:hypothetical protein